jgi:hypothetical protein
MFAQTLAYGLFSARVMSEGAGKFTREKAQRLIPPTNEFLRRFFYLITGPELDGEPFAPFVEDIVQTLDHTAMEVILEDFGQRRDPIVHFYETFLAAYDPKLRELRGVYYTPEPVVGYIVRSVDWILREKFGLKDGLADSAKFTHTREEKGETISEECHRVLILDPATGTATFLYEVIKFIREQFEKKKNRGQWESYVRHHLIPRIFGFELLMASYAVAHFKLGLQLFARDLGPLFQKDWAYHFQPEERLNIYLTNTLEDMHRAVELIGPGRFLSDEANKADDVKRHKPVLVMMGNPPYANFGQMNQGKWILGLLDEYKRGLNEKRSTSTTTSSNSSAGRSGASNSPGRASSASSRTTPISMASLTGGCASRYWRRSMKSTSSIFTATRRRKRSARTARAMTTSSTSWSASPS